MKILHISTKDKGGAANSCIRLHQGLVDIGVDSNVLLLNRTNFAIPDSFAYQAPRLPKLPAPDLSTRTRNKVRRIFKELHLLQPTLQTRPISQAVNHARHLLNRPGGLDSFSGAKTDYDITTQKIYREADLINLHWTAGFLDYEKFFSQNTKPLVWILHDMNPFTGGCHYAGSCTKFQQDCAICPQLAGTINPSYSHEIYSTKHSNLAGKSITVVTPSGWLKDCSERSSLFQNYPHFQIPYGLSASVFQPRDKFFSRQLLGLPVDKMIILFVADNVHNQRKGYHYLANALEKLTLNADVILCAVGVNNQAGNSAHVHVLGPVQDERLMSAVYSAADVFVIPSVEDNLPNTILEALMCGTPVIGFPIGGVPDAVENGVNGYICDSVSAEHLADTIQKFLRQPDVLDRRLIRESAVEKFDQRVQAESYLNLYKTILTDSEKPLV